MKLLSVFVLASILTLQGCATSNSRDVGVMYVTLKIIERDNGIDAEDVISSMQTLSSVIERDFTLQKGIIKTFDSVISLDGLDAADRLLVSHILNSLDEHFEEREESVRGKRALELISLVKQAAFYY